MGSGMETVEASWLQGAEEDGLNQTLTRKDVLWFLVEEVVPIKSSFYFILYGADGTGECPVVIGSAGLCQAVIDVHHF